MGETEVEVRVAIVEAWELDTTEQAGTLQACRSVLGLVGSSVRSPSQVSNKG